MSKRQDQNAPNDPLAHFPSRREIANEDGTDSPEALKEIPAADDASSPALSVSDPRLARLTETASAYARAARAECRRVGIYGIQGSERPGRA